MADVALPTEVKVTTKAKGQTVPSSASPPPFSLTSAVFVVRKEYAKKRNNAAAKARRAAKRGGDLQGVGIEVTEYKDGRLWGTGELTEEESEALYNL